MLLKLVQWKRKRRQKREAESLAQQVQRRARRIIVTVVALVALTCLFCFVMALCVRRGTAQALQAGQGVQGVDVLLLIDNSNSMFDKAGMGSDPELRRIEAAQLFIHYQGVDSGATDHRLGVIFFGGTARSVVPLTFLNRAERRTEIADLIAAPERMQWTNLDAALALARTTLETDSAPDRQRVVVLLTDGKPEWDTSPTAAERAAVITDLEAQGRAYAQQGIVLFTLLLENAATDADPEIAEVYVPLWQELAAATGGRFYAVREADALIDVYHDILLTLSGGATAGTIIEAQVSGEPQNHPVEIEAGLRRVTFVVRIEIVSGAGGRPGQVAVTLVRPDGRPLHPDDSGVRHSAYGTTAIWAVDQPAEGLWTVRIEGQGTVTVWKDYVPEPVLVPTATPVPTPTAVPVPTQTPTPVPTSTPSPALRVVQWPEAVLLGTPITLAIALNPAPAAAPELWAEWWIDGASSGRTRLLDDGRHGDHRAGDGHYTAVWMPEAVGTASVRAWVEVDGVVLDRWDGRASVAAVPRLALQVPDGGLVWRAERDAPVTTGWVVGDATPVAASGSLSVTVLDATGGVVVAATGEVGKVLAVPAPAAAGTYTVTVRAAGMTSFWEPFVDVVTVSVRVRRPISGWVIGGGLASVLVAAGAWRGWVHHRQLPRLAGQFRVLASPSTYGGAGSLDLSQLGKQQLVLGSQHNTFILPLQPEPWAELEALPDGSGVTLAPLGTIPVVVNQHRIVRNHSLADGDVIEVGDFKLRYECM